MIAVLRSGTASIFSFTPVTIGWSSAFSYTRLNRSPTISAVFTAPGLNSLCAINPAICTGACPATSNSPFTL